MLEKIEESADQIIVLKEAITFHLKCLHDQIVECKQQVERLPDSHKALESLLGQGNAAELEIQALAKQQTLIEQELVPLQPYLTIIDKVERLEQTIREQEELVEQKQGIIIQEGQFKPSAGKFVGEEVGVTIASLELDKLTLGLDIDRLSTDRDYQLRRLKELQVDRAVIRKQAQDIKLRISKVTTIIQQRRATVDTISSTVSEHKQIIEHAQPIDIKLRELQRSQTHLIAVVDIVNGVSLNAEALLEPATKPVSTD